MTQDEIIEMAKKVGCGHEAIDLHWVYPENLEAFAKLIAQHEREACAKEADHWQKITDKAGRINKDGEYIAAAIQARKQ